MVMRVQLFQDGESGVSFMCAQYPENCNYFVDVPTKYVVLLFLTIAAYGFTIYLDIFPVPWGSQKKAINKSMD